MARFPGKQLRIYGMILPDAEQHMVINVFFFLDLNLGIVWCETWCPETQDATTGNREKASQKFYSPKNPITWEDICTPQNLPETNTKPEEVWLDPY